MSGRQFKGHEACPRARWGGQAVLMPADDFLISLQTNRPRTQFTSSFQRLVCLLRKLPLCPGRAFRGSRKRQQPIVLILQNRIKRLPNPRKRVYRGTKTLQLKKKENRAHFPVLASFAPSVVHGHVHFQKICSADKFQERNVGRALLGSTNRVQAQ